MRPPLDPATPSGLLLCRVPSKTPAHTSLGSSHPEWAISAWSIPGHPSLCLLQPQLSHHGTLSVDSPKTPQLASISASAILPGHTLYREPRDNTIPCPLQLYLSCQGNLLHGAPQDPPSLYTPQPYPLPPGYPLCGESWNTPVYNHFNSSCPAQLPSW